MGTRAVVASIVALASCNSVLGLDETRLQNTSPRTLIFDNSASQTDLVDFPVMVVPDSSFDFRDVADPTTDIRFHDPDTDQDLPFEVESWNPGGESILWVRVPRIHAGSQTDHIDMHFGTGVHAQADPTGVWSEFGLVAHGLASDGTVPNAASAPYVGRGTTAGAKPGVVGDAITLPGYVVFDNSGPLLDGWQTFTLELWWYADVANMANIADQPGFIDRGGSLQGGRIFADATYPGTVTMQIDIWRDDGPLYAPVIIQPQRWVYIVYTFDGSRLDVYLNSIISQIKIGPPSALLGGQDNLTIGTRTAPAFIGMIDELRISPAPRNADWVNAQFLSMSRNFVSFGRPGTE